MYVSLFLLCPQGWRLLSAPLSSWRAGRSLPLEGCVKSWWTRPYLQPSVSPSIRLHPQVIDVFQHQCSVLSPYLLSLLSIFVVFSYSLTPPCSFLLPPDSSLFFSPTVWLILVVFSQVRAGPTRCVRCVICSWPLLLRLSCTTMAGLTSGEWDSFRLERQDNRQQVHYDCHVIVVAVVSVWVVFNN